MAKDELRIFTPIGMLGYGFSEEIFWSTMAEGVDAVILDAGSTDSGPSKLALGKSTGTRQAYERDLGVLVAGCHVYRKPLLIGKCLCVVPLVCLICMEGISHKLHLQALQGGMVRREAWTCLSTSSKKPFEEKATDP